MRKANRFRKAKLLMPSFVAVKRASFLSKMHKEISEIKEHKAKKFILNYWMSAVFNKKVHCQAATYKKHQIMKKVLTTLKARVTGKQMLRRFMVKAEKFDEQRLLARCLEALQGYRVVREESLALKLYNNKMAQNNHLGMFLRHWKVVSTRTRANGLKGEKVRKLHTALVRKVFFGRLVS
mmetsp:Transcript_26127/g.39928  ORF Transcript_26127/g.39928 Transcript_26127/m.39928 type:complete len:180 (+) Transcript_26127:1992-2531(+)|eukprot:CAMPEP_0170512846 /NCGR_PEP_ID=MMETSP0208-20121228/67072_1 /TAXON_ID=197538 /ORGANISM="Strombidium inclinatum, Strain S3" /LENGTH=179 /DNA_ID=CAMNT_0010796517 /DNA_START=3356 /DNA_END=3895 /DNA_ORIENTATION=-